MDESEILKLSTESRITGHLRPTTLPNKEMYLRDLHNISDSFVGRVDTLFLNGFIFECEILVINAMELYEKGYFDCACYSLRQAVELANNMIYFSELSDSQRDAEFKKWQLNEKLEAKKVGNFLNSYADNFIETKKVFNINFNKMKDVKQKLNTVVHKQGVNTFYYYLQANQSKNIVPVADFQRYIESVISTVAIIRLSVDPIPVLLLDEDMYFRTCIHKQ